jgi:hypothetical protein
METDYFQRRLSHIQAKYNRLITRANSPDPDGSNGLFCSERKDPHAPPGDLSSAVALCGIDRTKDLLSWERLPDLKTRSPQQRNVVLCNGWVRGADDQVFIYYASSDTRIHVATSTVERLLDYVLNTPEDGLRSAASVSQRMELIRRNKAVYG